VTNARTRIEREASRLGFTELRFAPVTRPTPRFDAFEDFVDAGRHGSMHYLDRGRAVRGDVSLRFPAESAVVLALDHHHVRPPDPGGLTGKVARYAWGRDYHNLFGKRLKKLQRRLRDAGIESWGGVDTAPILERAWAELSGLGFTGKSCVQIRPARSSWFFLGVLFIDQACAPDDPLVKDHCGACDKCLVGCPTEAYLGARRLDARRCIAYHTIESREPIPTELRAGFGRWVFGCDVCQEVCPHNAAPPEPDEDDLLPRNAWLDLQWLIEAEADEIDARFIGTPLRRPGVEGLRRNACVVLGNLGDPAAKGVLEQALRRGPLVAEHAHWALERL